MTFLNLGMCRFKHMPQDKRDRGLSSCRDKAMTYRYLGGTTFLILGICSFKPTPQATATGDAVLQKYFKYT